MTLVWIKSEGSVSWAPGVSDVDSDGKECVHMLAANEGSSSTTSILVKSSPPALKKRAQGRPEILPRAPRDEAHEDDLTNLLYIHEASILHNLAARFKKGKPHSFISRVLLSVNPIQDVNEPLELAGRKEVLDTPHPFSVAENAFQQLERQSTSQCIVISGESGSGKTETSKRVIRHLVMRTGEASTIDERLLAASPILEAFGNAQTVSNGNSSRFGKFVNLYFTNNQVRFRNAAIETYLLERSRVVCYDDNERSFHIFYELLAGASEDLRSDLHLELYDGPLMGGIHSGRDDAEFVRLASSMKLFGMSAEIQKEVFAVVAAVLHLTCLRFVDKDSTEGNIASLSASCGPHLTAAASLLAVPQDDLLRLLCERAMVLRGETMVSQRTSAAASQARDALAKALYQRLFDWLVVQINRGLDVAQEPPDPRTSCEAPSDLTCANFIGILDIFGFESFEKNSFEQLLINFANEALQTTFNEQVFQSELNLYKDEGLDTSGIASPPDDKCVECLALFRTSHKAADRRPGLLAALNTISVGPEPSDTKLIALLHRTFRGRPCFVDPHPRIAASTFIIEHYAGQVAYTINGFVSKNSNRLPPEADAFFLSQESSSDVLADMFAVSLQEGASNQASDGSSTKPVKSKAKKSKTSIAATFEDQIRALMKVIRSTQCSFVRCIKPNPGLDPTKGFDHAFVARQLLCLSIPQTAQLLQAGLPGRIAYATLQRTFDPVLSAKLPAHLQPGEAPRGLGFERIVVKCILRSLGADADACKFGKTRVFFASGALAAIDGKLKAIERGEASVPEDLAEDIETACTLVAARRLLIVAGCLRRRSQQLRMRKALRLRVVLFAQAHWRRQRTQRKFIHKRRAVIKLQAAWRKRCMRISLAVSAARAASAKRVQAFARGFVARKRYNQLRAAVRILQLAWQLKSSLFAYSASDNESVNTACTDPELAAAWDARQLAGPDLEEDAFVSRFPTSNSPNRSAVDALIDDMLRNDTMGIVTQAIAEDEETLETCHDTNRVVQKDSLENEEISCGAEFVPCDAAQSQDLHVSTAIEVEANAPRVLLSSQQMKPGAECEDVGYHADDDVRSLEDDEEEEEKVKDGTALEEEYGGDDDDNDDDDDDDNDDVVRGKKNTFLGPEGDEASVDEADVPQRRTTSLQDIANDKMSGDHTRVKRLHSRHAASTNPARRRQRHHEKRKPRSKTKPALPEPLTRLPANENGEDSKEQVFQPIDSFETHPVQKSTQDQKDGQDLDDDQDHVQHADEDLHQSRYDHDQEAKALCMASEELLRKEQDAHARRHSNEELTSMLMRLSPTAFTREDGGAVTNMSTPTNARSAAGRTRSSRRLSLRSTVVKESCDGEMSFSGKVHGLQAQEGTFMQVVDDYAQTEENASFSSKSSRDPRNRRSYRKFNFSAMFTLRKREERLVLRKLKAGMRKKHYRQVIEALVRARELELMAPDVLAAEQMIHRVKTLHAQQILREAMVLRNVESLIHAIDQAVRFGMEKDDPQGLLRDAREMLAKMQSRALPRHNSTRSSKSDQLGSKSMPVTGSSKAILASNGAVSVVGKNDGLQGDLRGARGGNGACGA